MPCLFGSFSSPGLRLGNGCEECSGRGWPLPWQDWFLSSCPSVLQRSSSNEGLALCRASAGRQDRGCERIQQTTELDLLSFTTWQMLFGNTSPFSVRLFDCPPRRFAGLLRSSPHCSIAAFSEGRLPGRSWFYALSRLPASVRRASEHSPTGGGGNGYLDSAGGNPDFLEACRDDVDYRRARSSQLDAGNQSPSTNLIVSRR